MAIAGNCKAMGASYTLCYGCEPMEVVGRYKFAFEGSCGDGWNRIRKGAFRDSLNIWAMEMK